MIGASLSALTRLIWPSALLAIALLLAVACGRTQTPMPMDAQMDAEAPDADDLVFPDAEILWPPEMGVEMDDIHDAEVNQLEAIDASDADLDESGLP